MESIACHISTCAVVTSERLLFHMLYIYLWCVQFQQIDKNMFSLQYADVDIIIVLMYKHINLNKRSLSGFDK